MKAERYYELLARENLDELGSMLSGPPPAEALLLASEEEEEAEQEASSLSCVVAKDSDESLEDVRYARSGVYPKWITSHDAYSAVDKIVGDDRLREALAAQPAARTAKQLEILESYLGRVGFAAKEIARAARFRRAIAGQVVVERGEPATALYIVVSGTLQQGERRLLGPGDSFGAAASLDDEEEEDNKNTQASYDSRVVSLTDETELVVLHRTDHVCVVKESRAAERRRAFQCIKKVPIFALWSRTRLNAVCDMLRWHRFSKGEAIVRQGEPCEHMYFVIEGRCQVAKDVFLKSRNRWPTAKRRWLAKTWTQVVTVKLMELGPDDYFGEKGILENVTRAATVTTLQDSLVVSLDRANLLGLLFKGTRTRQHFTELAGSSNLGYATEQEIISVLLATRANTSQQQQQQQHMASVAGHIASQKNVDLVSGVGLLATGKLDATGLVQLSEQNASTRRNHHPDHDNGTPVVAARRDDQARRATTQKRGIDAEELERAKRDLELRFRQHKERLVASSADEPHTNASCALDAATPTTTTPAAHLHRSTAALSCHNTLAAPSVVNGVHRLRQSRARGARAAAKALGLADYRDHTEGGGGGGGEIRASRFMDAVCGAATEAPPHRTTASMAPGASVLFPASSPASLHGSIDQWISTPRCCDVRAGSS